MVSELRSKKVGDHFVGLKGKVIPFLASYLKMGFNTIKIAGSWIRRIIYNLSNKVKSKGFLATLTGTLDDDNAWIIDSGASSHMTGESGQLHTLSKKSSSHAVELGDNNNYAVKGLGSTSLKLENGAKLHLNNILYVPGLKKTLLSISCRWKSFGLGKGFKH